MPVTLRQTLLSDAAMEYDVNQVDTEIDYCPSWVLTDQEESIAMRCAV